MNLSSHEMLASHARLQQLEANLFEERKGLIQSSNYNDAPNALYFQYYSMFEKFSGFADDYNAELAKFKNLVSDSLKQLRIENQQQNSNKMPMVTVDEAQNTNHISSVNMNMNMSNNSGAGGGGGVSGVPPPQINIATSTFNRNNMTNVQREIASLNNDNNNAYNNGSYIDDKPQQQQPPSPQIQIQTQPQSQSQSLSPSKPPSSTLPVDTLYEDKQPQQQQPLQPQSPPQPQTQPQPLQPRKPPVKNTKDSGHGHGHGGGHSGRAIAVAPTVTTVTKSRRVIVAKHKYQYSGQGFEVWRRNYMRPMYASTMLYIGLSFADKGKKLNIDDKGIIKLSQREERTQKERVIRYLSEKGGFSKGMIEQILFRINKTDKPFTLVRVRASLQFIYRGLEKINKAHNAKLREKEAASAAQKKKKDDDSKNDDNDESLEKQQNAIEIIHEFKRKSKVDWNAKANKKLYVNNFDILDKNTHYALTQKFLAYGALEKDIFIGKDTKGNPFAFVEFRNMKDAIRCFRVQNSNWNYNQNNTQKPINYPSYNNPSLCRKLNIEYNNTDKRQPTQSSNRNRNRNKKRSKKFYNTRR